MSTSSLKRNIFQRILGIPATKLPQDEGSWTFSGGKVEIDLKRVPELSKVNGAVRLEKKGLPERILVVHGDDDQYHAFRNKCQHMGRRLDPVPETKSVQCCSVNKSTYDYSGKVLSGPAKKAVNAYEVTETDGKLVIDI